MLGGYELVFEGRGVGWWGEKKVGTWQKLFLGVSTGFLLFRDYLRGCEYVSYVSSRPHCVRFFGVNENWGHGEKLFFWELAGFLRARVGLRCCEGRGYSRGVGSRSARF